MTDALRHRVLIVDDDAELIEFATRALEPCGFDVLHATNPFAAIREATEAKPHVIVLDLNMPGMDGLEVIRHLKRIPETKDIPVIAFTGEQLTDTDYARARVFDRIVHKEEGLDALANGIAGIMATCGTSAAS